MFIIGKNFLKETKVIFQENIAGAVDFRCFLPLYLTEVTREESEIVVCSLDDNSWQAEAVIDMDLFHQVNPTDRRESL